MAPGCRSSPRLTRVARAAYSARFTPMDTDLDTLERKLATLIEHTRALRAANDSLRREVAAVEERNRELAVRVQQASARLDALLSRIPSP